MSWVVYACLALGLSSALVGGVFQSFSDFVMRGLLDAEPAGGMESMQQLNRTVYRSAFLAMFMALVPATLAMAIYAWLKLSGAAQGFIIAAAIIYVTSVFIVTAAGNVPMNDQLDALAPTSADGHAYWATYGRVWTRWNHVRTLGSVVVAGLFLLTSVQLAAAAE
ncbi:MAG: anthrone oxygenase family protein [Myxococcota bacterium]